MERSPTPPPVPAKTPNATFDPEKELKNIRKLSKGERKEALAVWKENYADQRLALASLQSDLIEKVRVNPDTSQEELLDLVDKNGSRHHFTEEQKETARAVVEIYEEKHQIIKKVRETYPDNTDLFKALFGLSPIGKIEIVARPASLHVVCNNSIDLARVSTFDKDRLTSFWEIAKQVVSPTQGMTLPATHLSDTKGMVIAENGSRGGPLGDIGAHEEQHVFRRILIGAERRVSMRHEEGEIVEPKDVAKEMLKECKDGIEQFIEDELLAMMKGGISPEAARIAMSQDRYFNRYIRMHQETLAKDDSPEAQQVRAELGSDAFRETLWQELVEGAHTYEKLKRQLGLTDEETAALLAYEPLSKWPKLANRLVVQKK